MSAFLSAFSSVGFGEVDQHIPLSMVLKLLSSAMQAFIITVLWVIIAAGYVATWGTLIASVLKATGDP